MDMQKKILIVEDELAVRTALIERLQHAGFATLEARNGETGFGTAVNEKPDLILLDIVMPIMDGMTMLQKLRASGDWGKKVPVIFLTNLSVDDRLIKGIVANEPSFYLVKTEWNLEDVVQKIKETLSPDTARAS